MPEANVTWSDEGLVAHASVDVSIAVATDGGLVTPGAARRRGQAPIRDRRRGAVPRERARDRRLLQHELEGGAFSVSNLGMYGTLEFSAIINPPQSGILAGGAAKPQAVVVDGAVTVANVMRCTLSVDHRAIDGALAARWLAAFTTRIQDPAGDDDLSRQEQQQASLALVIRPQIVAHPGPPSRDASHGDLAEER